MKKTLLLLITVLTATFVGAQSIGDTFDGANNLSYTITSLTPAEAEVTGFTTPGDVTADYDLVIPATEMGYSITAVGLGAFSGNAAANRGGEGFELDYIKIKTVQLPASVTHLAIHAFRDLSNLTTINLENVVSTENSIFATCPLLSDVGSLDSMVTLGRFVFFSNPSLTSINVGSSLTTIGDNFLRDTGITGIQYNWDSTELVTAIAGFSTGSYLSDVDASTVTLYVPAGTKDDYEASPFFLTGMTVVEGTLSTNNVEKALGFSMYPNPTNGIISIKSKQLIDASITVYDINGRSLLSRKLNSTPSEINISNLASGLYIFRVQTENGEFSKRILKQ